MKNIFSLFIFIISFSIATNAQYGTGFIWKGGTGSNWNTAKNWSSGSIPGISDDVTIPSGTTFPPAITDSNNASVRNLTIASGATLNLNSGATPNIKGDLNNAGAITGNGTIKLNGPIMQNITGIGSINYLELNNTNGAAINAAARVTILRQLTVSAGSFITGDSLVLASVDSITTARIASLAPGSSIVGKVTVQQYLSGGSRKFCLMSHPFNCAIPLGQLLNVIDITGSGETDNGFVTTRSNAPSAFRYDPYAGNSSLFYDPGWKPFTSITRAAADSNKFNRYQGIRIFLRGAKGEGLGNRLSYTPSPAVIKMTGFINQGEQAITLYKGAAVIDGTSVQEFNLIGNPYPSPVDIGTVAHNALLSGDIVGSAFYIWNPSWGTAGQFQAIPINKESATPYYIPANTALLVRTDHDLATLHFTENNKSAAATGNLLNVQLDGVYLYVYDADYQTLDMLNVKFNDAATAGNDKYLDATKPIGPDFNFYSLSADNNRMAIDSRPYETGKVILLGVSSANTQDFIIRAENIAVPVGKQLYLHDKMLPKYVLLAKGTEYHFSITKDRSTQGDDRFELIMK